MARHGHGGHHTVLRQGWDRIESMYIAGKGTSKHADKQRPGVMDGKIYSSSTKHTYDRHWQRYCAAMAEDNYTVDGHKPRTLDEAAGYMPQYIERLKSSPGARPGTTMSAWSIRLMFSAPAKVMGLHAGDYDLPIRRRADIIRSRQPSSGDRNFSEKRNADLIEFCRASGLRNHKELQQIRGTDLVQDDDGRWAIHVAQGKGGKERDAHIYGTPDQVQRVVDMMHAAGDQVVWSHVSSAADIHSYRADYAWRVYSAHARDPRSIPASERYCCRGDMKGTWYDRRAMQIASRELGHERINVIAEHYLYRR